VPVRRARRDELVHYGVEARMPPLQGWGGYLLDVLFALGPVGNDEALKLENFEAWARTEGFEWEPWEAQLLLRLSREYYGEMHAATKWNADPPWPGCIPDFYRMAAIRAERGLKAERQYEQFLKG
jgi:hypothetical protein